VQRKVHKLAWPHAKRNLKIIANITRAWSDFGHIHSEHQGVITGLGRSFGQRQTRVREDGDTLNPESIAVPDPACGSGHILLVAYDILKALYLERGYKPKAIPRLILEKNLYGLDIDDRAAQMAGFALLMKARAGDRRLFTTTDDAGNL